MMTPESLALMAGLLGTLGEWWHARRGRRTARLAFGPVGPRSWTRMAPLLRVAAVVMLTWGWVQLWILKPKSRELAAPEATSRHLVLALDVSPSMQLEDAGEAHNLRRAQRASEVVSSILERADLSRLRMSVVAFY